MADLVQWLRAQLSEDEAAAEDTLSLHVRVGRFRGVDVQRWRITKSGEGIIDEDGGTLRAQQIFPAEAAHVIRHDPARVLREVEAKRRTLIRCQEEMLSGIPRLVHFAKQTLREMALSFADRPGFAEAIASAE